MANPICLSALKFYDAIKKQERFKSYAYGHTSPVVMPLGELLPFQFILPYFEGSPNQIIDAFVYDANTNKPISDDILRDLVNAGFIQLDVNGLSNAQVVMFPGGLIDAFDTEGQYYIAFGLNDDPTVYYSEVICFTSDISSYLEIEYWNPQSNFFLKNGVVSFANDFHFRVLLKSELGKPEYSFEEEATKRLGYNFIESQVSKKTYKFNTILPEYLCDALRLVRLCSNKILKSKDEEYNMLSFEMDVDWQNQGDLASVNCEFDIDNIIVNLGGFEQ